MESLMENVRELWIWVQRGLWLLLIAVAVQGSTLVQADTSQVMRRYTRSVEFDFTGWTARAAAVRWEQLASGEVSYLDEETRIDIVREYFQLTRDIRQVEAAISLVFSDPEIENPEMEAGDLIETRDGLQEQRVQIQGEAESIMAQQVAAVLAEDGIGFLGAPVPPVSFHITDTPYALIVSPREVIRQDASIQLDADLSLEERAALEDQVEEAQDVSALVVPTGGIGIYPTMVLESTSLPWILEVISHEWTHNYLSLRPLGMKYSASNDLRTMNETTASLIGREISRRVLERYYPDLLPPDVIPGAGESQEPVEPVFDFHAEMRETRVTVDAMLEEGEIEEAEQYMEQRRAFFWENGYAIRKLNQAYFAFHGAYADTPGGGAAGSDPVGEAVRALWRTMEDPVQFLRRMSWMDSKEDLAEAVQEIR